ncbi:MAG: sugar dehydrogenase [Bryobacteraceae bacterium]|jgi:glucose/arabinose dehydrogenase
MPLIPAARHLNFPTSVTADADGRLYIAESGLPFGGAPEGGIVSQVNPDGTVTPLVRGLRAPVNGVIWHSGGLIISEGGNPGRISCFNLSTGELRTLVDGLPGFGNYHTNMVVIGPDGKLYFSQGAMTNSGVLGLDSGDMPWLATIPHHCDIPGYDVTLTGFNAETRGAITGSFSPFGVPVSPGQKIAGRVPCTSSVMRCQMDGSGVELVAWGLRNAYGLGFLADGRMLATDQGADYRGSRPILNCPDFLYEVRHGAWYGWPDFFGGRPATDPGFRAPGDPDIQFLLSNHSELPRLELPLLEFEVNACATKFALVPTYIKQHAGDLIVALFGDESSLTGAEGPRVGRKLVRIRLADRSIHPVKPMPFERPIDVLFERVSHAAYVVDFGEFEIAPDKSIVARAGTGVLWKLPADFIS